MVEQLCLKEYWWVNCKGSVPAVTLNMEGKGNREMVERVPVGWWPDGLRDTGMPFMPTIIAGNEQAESMQIRRLVWDLVKAGEGINQVQSVVLRDIMDQEWIDLVVV